MQITDHEILQALLYVLVILLGYYAWTVRQKTDGNNADIDKLQDRISEMKVDIAQRHTRAEVREEIQAGIQPLRDSINNLASAMQQQNDLLVKVIRGDR